MPTAPPRDSYWRVAGLCGLVCLGWLWDLALGGGVAHALGWLIALLLVAAVSTLAVRAARLRGRQPTVPPAAQPAASEDATEIATAPAAQELPRPRRARAEELPSLPQLEEAADALFRVSGHAHAAFPGPATTDELAQAAAVLVVGDPPVGFIRLGVLDGYAYVEGLSVHPRAMRRGVGSALLAAAEDWARTGGYRELRLTTFTEIPWNGPFYRRRGFELLDSPDGELGRRLAAERAAPWSSIGPRAAMTKALGKPDGRLEEWHGD